VLGAPAAVDGSSGTAITTWGNRTDANGFQSAASDNNGLGIHVTAYTTAPKGTNTAHGNDAAAECLPKLLC
jgi:hypothetical protein